MKCDLMRSNAITTCHLRPNATKCDRKNEKTTLIFTMVLYVSGAVGLNVASYYLKTDSPSFYWLSKI
jgi:hypothetical protein